MADAATAAVAATAGADAAALIYLPSCPIPSPLAPSTPILPLTSSSLPFPLLPPIPSPPSHPSRPFLSIRLPLLPPCLLSPPLHPVDCCVTRPTVVRRQPATFEQQNPLMVLILRPVWMVGVVGRQQGEQLQFCQDGVFVFHEHAISRDRTRARDRLETSWQSIVARSTARTPVMHQQKVHASACAMALARSRPLDVCTPRDRNATISIASRQRRDAMVAISRDRERPAVPVGESVGEVVRATGLGRWVIGGTGCRMRTAVLLTSVYFRCHFCDRIAKKMGSLRA